MKPKNETSNVGAVATDDGASLVVPGGWVPENATFSLAARRDPASGLWEAVVPDFSIAGQGESLEGAVGNAFELLTDYFALSARDGLSYWDARRPLPLRARLPLYTGRLLRVIADRRRERRATDREFLRLPFHTERLAH